jgi:hypothetical protein
MDVTPSQFIELAIKLVVPMRREFGRSVRVEHMLSDPNYAQAVLALAATSQNERLREQAQYLQGLLGGPRSVSAPPATPPEAGPSAGGGLSVDDETAYLEALKAEKYRRGLR